MANEKRMGPKFTPGPWRLRALGGPSVHVVGRVEFANGKTFSGPPGDVVAFVTDAKGERADCANARLIAQAPSLLRLARAIWGMRGHVDGANAYAPLIEQARSILDAVEGK